MPGHAVTCQDMVWCSCTPV